MTCEECLRRVGLELDDAIEDEERAGLSGHLLACPACSHHRERLRAAVVRLDAACLPIREEASEIVTAFGDRRPGRETVPVRQPWRLFWGLFTALVFLLLIAIIAAVARGS